MTFRSPTLITAAGETSEPVPDVVGIATSRTLWSSCGKSATRLRASRNGSDSSRMLSSGLSWNRRIAFAASITEPPPSAMIASASKRSSCLHAGTDLRLGRFRLDSGEHVHCAAVR